MKILLKIDRWIEKGSSITLVFCVMLMLFLSVLSIVLRWFNSSIMGIDPLVRHLVLLSAFLGGVLTTGRGTHIGIDIISKYLENRGWQRAKDNIARIISFTSFVTLFWLIGAAWDFCKIEMEYGKVSDFGVHSGFLVGIIPLGFSLIAYRFFFIFLASFQKGEVGGAKGAGPAS